MTTLLQDLRYALRLFRKRPGFIAIAVLTLGLGIGANTATFSVVNSFLLRPLPNAEPDRLLMIQRSAGAAEDSDSVYSYPVFSELRQQSRTLGSSAAFASHRLTLDTVDGPEMIFGSAVTSEFFSVLGVSPVLGRAFLPGEDEPNRPKLVILSHSLWQRRFNSDPGVIGRALISDKESYEIVGVMPTGFKFDLFPDFPRVEFFTPLNPGPRMVEASNIRWLRVIARLAPDASLEAARSELALIAERINQQTVDARPAASRNEELSAVTLKRFFIGDAGRPLLILLGAVGFVLLIACANVANLLLAHGVGRQKEIAIRAVLGAGRRRLIVQLLTESLLLAGAGGIVALLLLTALLASYLPARRAMNVDPMTALRYE